MTKNILSVLLNGKPVGILEQTLTGKMQFTYEDSAAQAISFSMPLRQEAYEESACQAFFGGLLPESDAARRAIGKHYGISPNNTFALLKAIGHDCAGAISFYPPNEIPSFQNHFPLAGKIISDKELYELILALPKKPLFGERLSLAGVHDKAAVCLIDNQIALPENNCPTTHILKPPAAGFEDIVGNEYLCLTLASQLGFSVPKIEVRHAENIPYLLVERYDRFFENNHIRRIQQEDFCQALGILSIHKYQNEGGPGFKQCFELIKNTSHPAIDINTLASLLVFNFLVGNVDAHGKNFSLLHQESSEISLTPVYDIICTRIYPELSTKMAMKIGSQYEADKVMPRHWEELCNNINFNFLKLKNIIRKQAEDILIILEANKGDYIEATRNEMVVDKIIDYLNKHIPKILKQFQD